MKVAAAEELKLPKDAVLGEVLLSFVVIENYRGILLYNDNTIRLQARQCRLSIHGKRLHIDYYNHEEMKITGQIQSMEFE